MAARGRRLGFICCCIFAGLLSISSSAAAFGGRVEIPALSHHGIPQPGGVAVDRFGDLYVAEGAESGAKEIHIFGPEGTPLKPFVASANGSRPKSIAVDSECSVYVSDWNKVVKYVLKEQTDCKPPNLSPGSEYEFSVEVVKQAGLGVAVNPATDNLYVTEAPICCGTINDHKSRISIYKPDGSLIKSCPETVSEARYWGIGVYGANGNIYAVDQGEPSAKNKAEHDKLYIFSPDCTKELKVITGENVPNTEACPKCSVGFKDLEKDELAVDQSNGDVLVGDVRNHKVVDEFDFEGNFVEQLPPKAPSFTDSEPSGVGIDNTCALAEPPVTGAACEVPFPTNRNAYISSKDEESKGSVLAFGFPSELPPVIESESVAAISPTEAVLNARVNPEGNATTVHFEYTTETAFEEHGFEGAVKVPVPDISIGDTKGGVAIHQPIAQLTPVTAYRYRAFATNKFAPPEGVLGKPLTFTTRTQPIPGLPDHRAYEMVSPPAKNGADVLENTSVMGAENGKAVTFASLAAFGDAVSSPILSYYRAERGDEAWATHGISPPLAPNGSETLIGNPMTFSGDLRRSIWQAFPAPPQLPGEQACAIDFFRHELPEGSWENLTPVVPNPCNFGAGRGDTARFEGADDAQSVVAFNSTQQLTADGQPEGTPGAYAWSAEDGEVHFLAYKPDGSPISVPSFIGSGGGENKNTVAADGSQVVFSAGDGNVYLRENPGRPQSPVEEGKCTVPSDACTIEASASQRTVPPTFTPKNSTKTFQGASLSGDKVLFRTSVQLLDSDEDESMDMYLYEPGSDTLRRISVNGTGEENEAEAQEEVLDSGEDLNEVYFAARGRLVAGQPEEAGMHIYAWHEDGSESGSLAYVATLSEGLDSSDWAGNPTTKRPLVQASSNGRYLLFTAKTKLGSYENAGHAELYRYDSATEERQCVSCDPSGEEASGGAGLQVTDSLFNGIGDRAGFRSRNVLDNGRVFFETADALNSRDSNGKGDVYEWEPNGVGSCAGEAEDGGCLYLISAGTGNADSRFANATPTGDDVFFFTHDRLVGWDVDGNVDLYDARVNGGLPEPPPAPQSCLGDACQPPPVPLNDSTPASSSFQGPGNITEQPKKNSCPKGRHRAHGAKKGRCVKGSKHQHKKKKANGNRRAGR